MRIIGLMSGTSMDGIDAVLMETDGEQYIKCKETASLAYSSEFQSALKTAEKIINQHAHQLIDEKLPLTKQILTNHFSDLIQQSTVLHAKAIQQLLAKTDYSVSQIDYIGYHGQTLCHRPQQQFSLQVGNADFLANQLKIPVVTDFRSNDLLHGGQGAPLAPLYHQALMQQLSLPAMVMVNIGGIANMSVMTGHTYNDIHGGFDTGPGNVLLDQFVRDWTDQAFQFDHDGQFGLRGHIDDNFLTVLFNYTARMKNSENYYHQLPAKSLDGHDICYIPEILQRFPKGNEQQLYNGCATLAAFTAYTIAQSTQLLSCFIPQHWIIAGGGTKHPVIIQMLKQYLSETVNDNISVQTAEQAGLKSTYLEAELIAWLTARSVKNLPLTIPQTTGVSKPMSGGKIVSPYYYE